MIPRRAQKKPGISAWPLGQTGKLQTRRGDVRGANGVYLFGPAALVPQSRPDNSGSAASTSSGQQLQRAGARQYFGTG